MMVYGRKKEEFLEKTNKIETFKSSYNLLTFFNKDTEKFQINKSVKLKMRLVHSCWSSLRVHSNVLILACLWLLS